MQISVIGTGYVGLVVGACLAETGNQVTCADVDERKIAGLRRGKLPIYEPGLQELVTRNASEGRLRFTTAAMEAIGGADVAFIAVGTPPGEDGSADLRHVLAVAETIGRAMRREMVVVTKSTVPVGTAAKVAAVIGGRAAHPFHVCSNPEFLKEGSAVEDFLRPDRVVIGAETDFARSVMAELYAPFVRTGRPILFMDVASAEMTKYAANGMLAARISYMNEIALLCERVGANVDHVRRGVGTDARIGPAFLFPGPGYGGSCFPKDVKALIRTGGEFGVPMGVLHAVHQANERQRRVLFAKMAAALDGDLEGSRIAVWGLAFKPNTDDLRESPALALIDALLAAGAEVVAHDPIAMAAARAVYEGRDAHARPQLVASSYEALEGAHALVIATDWNEYRHPDFARIRRALTLPLIVDGRNLYDVARMGELGFHYYSIGRATAHPAPLALERPVGDERVTGATNGERVGPTPIELLPVAIPPAAGGPGADLTPPG